VNPSRIAIIVEGPKTEPPIFSSLSRLFFSKSAETENVSLEIIQFPFCGNIYNFYDVLLKDELTEEGTLSLSVDTIPLLQERVRNFCRDGRRRELLPGLSQETIDRLLSYKRNDFAQIFLFFDIELQDPRTDKDEVIRRLTNIFSDETDNGKLFITYPMIEALKDVTAEGTCDQNCLLPISDIVNYKETVGSRSSFPDIRKYKEETWKLFCKIAVQRASCLLTENCPPCDALTSKPLLSFQKYREQGTQETLYLRQYENHISVKSEVMILSSLPLFLLDYYQESFWKKMIDV